MSFEQFFSSVAKWGHQCWQDRIKVKNPEAEQDANLPKKEVLDAHISEFDNTYKAKNMVIKFD